jgi:hypothetical protein
MTAHSGRTIRILMVDDHQVVCQGFCGFLNGKPDPARDLRLQALEDACMGRRREL